MTPGLPSIAWGRRLRVAAAMFLALVAIAGGLRIAPKPPILSSQSWSLAVYASGGELLRLTLADDEQYRLRTPLERMSPQFVEAIVLYEDRWFRFHPGANPGALVRSAFTTLSGERRAGGSTITMQLARRLYGIDTRSIRGKLKQIGAALWLELRHSKREILEAYLNLTPFGGNIEGVGAASLVYFQKPAERLTLPEAIALAVVPQNPQRRSMTENTAALAAARTRLWQRWERRRPEDRRWAADQQLALRAETRHALPFAAPHAVESLLRNRGGAPRQAATGAIRSSLDLRLQNLLERVIGDHLRARSGSGLANASALLLDASTMQVKALVGSANYFDSAIAGQVNGTQAKRSPGSTLKPFIYALALDQGILHPQTMLKDAPTAFGPFSPENFDGRFAGPISAQDALIRSRNIPAVSVAAQLAKPGLYEFLERAGVGRLASPDHYGLALVLGGGEVTMEELAGLYAVLANRGVWRPLGYLATPAASPNEGVRLLSAEAAFVATDMLRHNPRPDTQAPAQPAVAWKTGTSWGFRDAWTAGIFGRYVLVVWVGNFDGSSNPALIGIEAAAPLFLHIVDAIRAQRLDPGEIAWRQPPDLRQIEVCAASGQLPDRLCPARIKTWFIAGKSPIKQSALHRTVWVDRHTGEAGCRPRPNTEAKVYEFWPSDLQHVFSDAGLPRRAPPPGSACEADGADEGGPMIASPLRGVAYAIRSSRPEPLMLRADAPAGVGTLFWFVDDALIGRSKPGTTLLWQPTAARSFTVRVVDDAGRSDSRSLAVEFVP